MDRPTETKEAPTRGQERFKMADFKPETAAQLLPSWGMEKSADWLSHNFPLEKT